MYLKRTFCFGLVVNILIINGFLYEMFWISPKKTTLDFCNFSKTFSSSFNGKFDVKSFQQRGNGSYFMSFLFTCMYIKTQIMSLCMLQLLILPAVTNHLKIRGNICKAIKLKLPYWKCSFSNVIRKCRPGK